MVVVVGGVGGVWQPVVTLEQGTPPISPTPTSHVPPLLTGSHVFVLVLLRSDTGKGTQVQRCSLAVAGAPPPPLLLLLEQEQGGSSAEHVPPAAPPTHLGFLLYRAVVEALRWKRQDLNPGLRSSARSWCIPLLPRNEDVVVLPSARGAHTDNRVVTTPSIKGD